MSELPLSDLLVAAADNMRAELQLRLLPHPGELGTAREQIVREFLSAHLPRRFDVSTGFAFDCTGRLSRQLDIVIFDANVCPRFNIPGGKSLFPCEAIVAVGQVKSAVTGKDKLKHAIENLASVKALDRSANGTAYDTRYGEKLSPSANHLHQIFGFLLVIGDAMAPETMADVLLEEAFSTTVSCLPNAIIALDRYLVTYCDDGGVCPNPMDARGVAVHTSSNPSDVLLHFYLLLGQAIEATRTASLSYWEYLSKYRDIEAMVHGSCVDDPPPHLGRWTET